MNKGLIEHFEMLTDPRVERTKIALNLIKNDTSRNASMKRKRFMAALEDDFRETIIRQVI